MNGKRLSVGNVLGRLAPVIALCLFLGAGPVMGADAIDPEADRILRSMSTYLGVAKVFTVDTDIDFEVVAQNGQKLQLSSFASVVLRRPANFHIQRKGMIVDTEFIYDGITLTLHGRNLNIYAQLEVPGTIGDAIIAYEAETGIPAPGADLLFADPYAVLSSGVESGAYMGTAYVNGVECHHLAFREAEVDWQIWVQTGDAPLPMKYVITTKWHTAAPQYEIRFRDWETTPRINEELFTFAVPEGARRLETILVDEIGEFTDAEEVR